MHINRKEIKALSRDQIRGNIWTIFLCNFVINLIVGALGGFPFFGVIGLFMIAPVLSFGMIINYIDITCDGEASVDRVFSGFRNFAKVWILNFLTRFFTAMWSLLLIIPGIIKHYSYSLAPYILAENPEFSALDAIKLSRRMTKGHKGDLFLLRLSFAGWYILGYAVYGFYVFYFMTELIRIISDPFNYTPPNLMLWICLFLLMFIVSAFLEIYLAPYMGASYANAYRKIKEQYLLDTLGA